MRTHTTDNRLEAQTAVRLPQGDYEQLRVRARAEDRPIAHLVRRGVRIVLESAPSAGVDELTRSEP